MPCYHARELALDRAKRTGARVVLGSATPSMVTWSNLAPEGAISLARLTRRIADKPLPDVVVVDMRQELSAGNRRLLKYLRISLPFILRPFAAASIRYLVTMSSILLSILPAPVAKFILPISNTIEYLVSSDVEPFTEMYCRFNSNAETSSEFS